MDDKHVIEILEKIKNFSLEQERKASIRQRISFYMKEIEERKNIIPEKSPFFSFFVHRSFLAPSLLLILFFIGGGMSLYSEKTLPGDPLYFIKTKINEPVRGVAFMTSSLKADWSGELINRRIQETEKLALQERLSSEVKEFLTRSINIEKQKGDDAIDNLDEGEAQKEREKINARVALYESTLNEFSSVPENAPMTAKALTPTFQEKGRSIETFSFERYIANLEEESQPFSIETIAQNRQEETRIRLQNIKTENINAERLIKKISDLEKLTKEGSLLLEKSSYQEAYLIFKEVLRELIDIEVEVYSEERF